MFAISKERLEEIFSDFGEISSVYYPVDLKNLKPKGFAFVRYLNQSDAEKAIYEMDENNFGYGRNISVKFVHQKTYFSQDESN